MKLIQVIRPWWESIRVRMMAMLLFVNIVIIAILSVGAYSIYQDSFIRELAGSRTDVLRQIAERSRQFKISLYTLSNLFESNPGFLACTTALNSDNLETFQTFMDATTRQLQESFIQPDLDFYVVYVSASGIGYCSRPVPDEYDYMDPRLKVWNRNVVDANGKIVDVGSYRDRSLGTASFSAARAILNGEEIVGFLMINADERQLYQMYEEVISEGSNIYITSDAGQIISSNRGELIGFNYFNMDKLGELFAGKDYMITRASGAPVLFTRYHDEESGFTVFEEAPLDQVLQPLRNIRRVVILLALLCLAGGIALAWHFSRRIAAPIQELRDDLRDVERGNLKQTFSIHSYTELNELSCGMSDMLTCICGLIESIHKNEQEKRRIERNWLQALINPHFIYNTLFSVKCMVDMHRNEEAAIMLTHFIAILRDILSTQNEMVTVADQMESLREYVTLQQYRYEHAFDSIIEYDEAAASCYLPKLLVQPLVENSIQHGVDMQSTNGMITVIARRKGREIVIEVEDNGVGMTAEKIRQVMEAPEVTDRPHLGIKNVHDRIKLYYGSSGALQIESEPGRGTRITLRIPTEEQNKEASC